MKRTIIFFILFLWCGLLACSVTSTNDQDIVKTLSSYNEDYYVLSFFEKTDQGNDDFTNPHYEIYDVSTSNLLFSFDANDLSRRLINIYFYRDYLVAYSIDDERNYAICVYDISSSSMSLIKQFDITYGETSLVHQTDHYVILNQIIENSDNNYQNSVHFLDLDDLEGWDVVTPIYYTLTSENSPNFSFYEGGQRVKHMSYAFYVYDEDIYYAHYPEMDEVNIYYSHIDDLFEADELIYSLPDLNTSVDVIEIFSGLVYHFDSEKMHIINHQMDTLTSSTITLDPFRRCNKYECIGLGFSNHFATDGQHLIVMDSGLSQINNDTLRFYVSPLEGSAEDVENQTYLLVTDIVFTNQQVEFFVTDEMLYVFARDTSMQSQYVVHQVALDEGDIYT